jgi:hypothetical protein
MTLGRVRVSVRGLIGLIDHVPVRKLSRLGMTKTLLTRLDLNRCVKGGPGSNSPLDFRQSSFTHTTQVLGHSPAKRFRRSPLSRQAIFPFRFSPLGWSGDLEGLASTSGVCHTIIHAVARRTTPSPKNPSTAAIGAMTWAMSLASVNNLVIASFRFIRHVPFPTRVQLVGNDSLWVGISKGVLTEEGRSFAGLDGSFTPIQTGRWNWECRCDSQPRFLLLTATLCA